MSCMFKIQTRLINYKISLREIGVKEYIYK